MSNNVNSLSLTLIGFPNAGKSSIASTLAMKGDIRIGREPGWTKGVYAYELQDSSGDTFLEIYDTPGFEDIDAIVSYIAEQENRQNETVDFLELLKDYNKKNYEDDKADTELLKTLNKSDILIYVINVSKEYSKYHDKNEIEFVSRLSIEAEIPLKIIFNPESKEIRYDELWRKALEKVLNSPMIMEFDAKNARHIDTVELLNFLVTDLDGKREVVQKYKEIIDNKIKILSNSISKSLYDFYQNTKECECKKSDRIGKEAKCQKELEKKIYEDVKKYYEKLTCTALGVEKEDKLQYEITNNIQQLNEVFTINNEIKKNFIPLLIAFISIIAGIVVGVLAHDAWAGIVVCVGLFTFEYWLKKEDLEKIGIVYNLKKNALDSSVNFINYTLTYLDTLLSHGYANRDPIEVLDVKSYILEKDIKNFKLIHNNFIKGIGKDKNIKKLTTFLQTKIEEIIEAGKIKDMA